MAAAKDAAAATTSDAAEGATADGDAERCRLYLITPAALDPDAFAEELRAAVGAGDVACLQLRLKDVDDDAIRRACDVLRPICHEHDVAFLVNDRPDLAAQCGADGVHVGQQDARYQEARRIVGPDATVGVTCHDSRDLALRAAEAGTDYVAFGAFFPTMTKERKFAPEPDLLRWWHDITVVPSVAIGGIKVENCGTLAEAGADFIAVVTGVWNHPEGPAAAVTAFNKVLGEGRPRRRSTEIQ